MSVSSQDLANAKNGTIWQNKNKDITYFLRKINGIYEVWTSEYSNQHYPVTISQAVTYANQHNLTNANTDAKPKSPVATTGTNRASKANNLSGQADGDSGRNKTSSDAIKRAQSTGSSGKASTSSLNWYVPNEKWIPGNETAGNKPGKRLKNPLGYMASYTYQISLYMITPDAYEQFVAGGRKNIHQFSRSVAATEQEKRSKSFSTESAIKGGAYLVAQSGGVGSDEQRIPGLEYDLYIDRLSFTHWVNPKSTGTTTSNGEFKFSIVEPYGFSFVTKLRNAQKELQNYSKGMSILADTTKQFFVLGIKFYGWDQSGNQVTGNQEFEGQQLDPMASGSSALFETFYDLIISEFKFKIDGKSTTYNISAASTAAGMGVNVKRGYLYTSASVSGRTVHDALAGPNGLITKLNKDQQNLKNVVPIKYNIEWIGDAEEIARSSLLSDNEVNKAKQSGASVANTKQVNPNTEITATPQPDKHEISLGSRPITECIDFIISRSQWFEDKLVTGYIDKPENNPKTKSPDESKNPKPEKFKWFNISPKITNITWDENIKDWAYDITYMIQTYLMPAIDNPYVKNTEQYYGPHKRYDYWYTGQNSEILSYSQELNTSYFTSVLGSPPDNTSLTNRPGAGNAVGSPSAGASTAPNSQPVMMPGGGGNKSQAVKSSVRTSLYDPGAWVTAKVEILGDPDYLMQDTATGINDLITRHYKAPSSFTINPTGGQVFLEIDFKEAVDYSSSGIGAPGVDSQGGTLSLNESISFGTFGNDNVVDPVTGEVVIKGVRYMLLTVKSSFTNGAFKQELSAVMTPFGDSLSALTESARQDVAAALKGPNTESPTATTTEKTSQSPSNVVNTSPPVKKNDADDDKSGG